MFSFFKDYFPKTSETISKSFDKFYESSKYFLNAINASKSLPASVASVVINQASTYAVTEFLLGKLFLAKGLKGFGNIFNSNKDLSSKAVDFTYKTVVDHPSSTVFLSIIAGLIQSKNDVIEIAKNIYEVSKNLGNSFISGLEGAGEAVKVPMALFEDTLAIKDLDFPFPNIQEDHEVQLSGEINA